MTDSHLRHTALGYLSRREHSCWELRAKLKQKFTGIDSSTIEQLLNELIQEGWLSDSRFVEMYIRSRAARGFGPVKIQQELLQRGVLAELIEEGFSNSAIDWPKLEKQVSIKKFGEITSKDFNAQIKLKRFLYYRGFE